MLCLGLDFCIEVLLDVLDIGIKCGVYFLLEGAVELAQALL